MMTTTRSFSLGRRGEAQWERLRAGYILSQKSGEIVLVASDSQDVRDEVRRRLEAMAPHVEVIAPNEGVTLAIHALAKMRAEGEKLPVAWIEAPASSPEPASDIRWIEALVVLNQTRDALRMHGPCHVVLAGPRSLNELVRRRAPDLTSFMSIVLLLDDTLEELVTQQGTLTWLHLSDLHVQSESWQHDHVLGALVRDLPRLLDDRELRPDLLFVTGDVAARGLRTEYDGAVRVLDELAKQLGLDRRQQVFVVPGNHDVDRNKIGRLAKRDHGSLLELSGKDLRDAVGELLGDAKEFRLYSERLEDWCAFTETLLGRARSVSLDRPWRSDVVDVRGLPVGVISLCTAWASGPDDRKGSLILGERQIHDMVAEARDGGAHLVIALMHHPLHWLHDGEHSAIRGRLERDTDVVLHGHVHDAHVALHLAARSARVEIGAGAAYAGLDEDRYHGFSVGRLDVAEGRLDVHCFTWSTQSGRWHPAAGVPGADDSGRCSFSFSPAAIAPEVSRRAGHEVLATRLRHAAARVYATVDFAGLGAGGPRKHVTLEQIFVPLYLDAQEVEGSIGQWVEQKDEEVSSDDDGESDAYEFVSGRVTMDGLVAMLAAGYEIVVLGGPGSGKSTLTRYLASTIGRREGGPVPILLTVRDWIAEGKREHLLDMAARQATSVLSVRTDREALEALCESGRAILIVDGVDEAADAAVRRGLRDQVHGLVTRFPRLPVLVTSRIAGYHDVPLDDDMFIQLTLESFDDEAIEQFVRRWYDLVEDDPTIRLRKRVDLLHALEVEPRAKELARNPLLATLIGMVHFSHAQLPGDRAKLYGMMIELLLVTWPAERKRELPELHGTMQQPMLEKLALRLQEQRAGIEDHQTSAEVLIDVKRLESMLEELVTERFPERSMPEQRHLARRWGKWLVDGCGLLQEQQPGRVGFLHLSLMEYMAGRALLERSLGSGYEAVAELVVDRHSQAVWQETLLLMLGSENSNRELGHAVVERLLTAELGKAAKWPTYIFGLALLREDVDVGNQRERMLVSTCREAVDVQPEQWYVASEKLGHVVRFSRVHGHAIRKWLEASLLEATGDLLVGVLALAGVALPWAALPWEEARSLLATRSDISMVALTLLDLGPRRAEGLWGRDRATKDVWASWASRTPLMSVVPRSLESFEYQGAEEIGGVWIAPLLLRADWIARAIGSAAERLEDERRMDGRKGLPLATSWVVPPDMRIRASLACSFLGCRFGGQALEGPLLDFLRPFPKRFLVDFLEDFAAQVSLLSPWHSLLPVSTDFVWHFIGRFLLPPSLFFTAHLPRYLAVRSSQYFSQALTLEFVSDFAREFARPFSYDLARHFPLNFTSELVLHDKDVPQDPTTALSDRLVRPVTWNDAMCGLTGLFSAVIAEAHAGCAIGLGLEEPDDKVSALATLRIHNRWLNVFFTPLAEYATKSRPLPDHPDLHALLLTYGLVQYQTTWEWPDCPHWRSWFAGAPPEHWLPAHVWHLVRSIQDPHDSTHREQADAALDRSDWPELAQALRETTLVPTPPEVLALFDHGHDDRPSPPQ